MKRCAVAVLLVLALSGCGSADGEGLGDKPRTLILVVDGLRPDYVTPSLMPRLNALAEAGVRGLAHHAVFPTVTRVNGPSIFTGRLPGGHGMLGNSIYLPEVDSSRVLDAGDREDLLLIDRGTSGRLLTAPTLGELLEERGLVFFAASSGSSGSGTLMNHRGAGGGLVHHEFALPDTLASVAESLLGPLPTEASSVQRLARAVDAVLRIGLDRADADVLAAWLTEPDGTAHRTGMGSPETVTVLGAVDAEIGRLVDGLEDRGVLATTNVLVTSDHGFATRVGEASLTDLLVGAGLKAGDDSRDVVVAGDAIHVREGGDRRIGEIVRLLQQTPWVGPVFTRATTPGAELGAHPGTASFSSIGWDHERSADVLTGAGWSDDVNEHGYPGAVRSPGVAGHGSTSPWDIRATLVASGPDVKNGVTTEVPSGNIDLVPTTLALMGVDASTPLDGRVLSEIMVGGPAPSSVEVVSTPVVAQTDGYHVTVDRVTVGATTYLRGTTVERSR